MSERVVVWWSAGAARASVIGLALTIGSTRREIQWSFAHAIVRDRWRKLRGVHDGHVSGAARAIFGALRHFELHPARDWWWRS